MNYVLPIFINMQTTATSLLENIIRQEILLLREQDEFPIKTVNLFLGRLQIDYPLMYKQLFDKQPSYLNNKSMRAAVYKELSTSTDTDIKNVYQSVKKTLEDGGMIPKDLNFFQDVIKKSAELKAKQMAPKVPPIEQQLKNKKIADKIISADGVLWDNETDALNAIKSIKTQDQYYWVNQYVCDYMKRKGMYANGFSLIKYLMTFSGRNLIGTDTIIDQETGAKKKYGTVTKTVKSLAYLGQRDMFRIKPELDWWTQIYSHIKSLSKQNYDKWNSLKYTQGYDPVNTHDIQIESHMDRLNDLYGKAEKSYKMQKSVTKVFTQNPFGGAFNSISTAREYMDNDPAGFLSYAAIFASFFAGPAAMLLATGLSAASGVSSWEQGDYDIGGSEFIWTALFAIGVVLKLPSVQVLKNASKLKIANAMAKSDFKTLNQLEMLALTDVAKLTKTNSKVIQSELNQLMKQRAKNVVANARFKANESIPNYIINEIAAGTIQASAVGAKILNKIKTPLAGVALWWKAETDWWPAIYNELDIDGKSAFDTQIEAFDDELTQIHNQENDIDISNISQEEAKKELEQLMKSFN